MQVTPDDASLLCALGDITLDDKHYQKAWDVSKGRSTRAQRSLARSAQRQQHWEEVGSCTYAVAVTTHGDPSAVVHSVAITPQNVSSARHSIWSHGTVSSKRAWIASAYMVLLVMLCGYETM